MKEVKNNAPAERLDEKEREDVLSMIKLYLKLTTEEKLTARGVLVGLTLSRGPVSVA